MTIPAYDNRREYAGDGTTNAWSFPVYFLSNADIVVVRRNADDTETTLTYGTHYSVSGAGNQAGGTVTPLIPTVVGATYVIFRSPPLTQATSFQNGSALPAATIISEFDKLTMITQRLQEQIDRSVRMRETDAAIDPEADFFAPLSTETAARIAADETEAVTRANADNALASLIAGATGPIAGQFFDATLAVQFASIDPAQTVLYTAGHSTPGDGGAARFVRSETETWLQSLDGAYWKLSVNRVYAEMCGAVGPGPHDAAIARAYGESPIVYLGPRGFKVTAPIAVPGDGGLIGEGRAVTYLEAVGCTAIAPVDGGRAPVISDMTLISDNTPGTWGILLSNNHNGARPSRVDIFGFGASTPIVEGETAYDRGGGIACVGGWETTDMWAPVLDQVRVSYCGTGIFGDHVNTMTLLGCISRLNYGHNLEVQWCVSLASVCGQYEAVLTAAPDETPTIYPATAIKLTRVVGGTLDAIYAENMTESLVKLINCEAVSLAGVYVDNAGDETTGTMIEVIASAACSIGPVKISGLYTADKRAITFDAASYNNTVSSLEIVGSAADFATAIEDLGVGNYIGPCTVNGTLYPPMNAPRLPTYTVAAANALPSGRRLAGSLARISNGDGGATCLAISDSTTWYRVPLGAAISGT